MPDPKRPCDIEGCDAPAVVHLTQVVNNKSSTHSLCRKCAREKGIRSAPEQDPAVELLAQILEPRAREESAPGRAACNGCGMTMAAFREGGRLGCAECYRTFEARLRRVLNRIHGSSRHIGKMHLVPDSAAGRNHRAEELRRSLQRAIEVEDFERAAVLRDQLGSTEQPEPS